MKFQAVRVSVNHTTVHAASPAITEEVKPVCSTLCGAYLAGYSPIALSDPVSCRRCLRIIKGSRGRRRGP